MLQEEWDWLGEYALEEQDRECGDQLRGFCENVSDK